MFKNLTAVIVVLSLGGIFVMENPVFSNINPPDHTAKAFENMVKSINSGGDPIVKSITTIKGDGHSFEKTAWSSDSRYIAVMKTEKNDNGISVVIISRDKNKVIKELPLYENISATNEPIAFSPDGHYLAAAVKGTIRLWETKTWTKVQDIQGSNKKDPYTAFGPTSLVFSLDSQYIACLFDTAFWWPPNEFRRDNVVLEKWEKKAQDEALGHTHLQERINGDFGERAQTIVTFAIANGKKIFHFRTPEFRNKTYFTFPENLTYTQNDKILLNSITENRYDISDNHATKYGYLQFRNSKTGELIKQMSITSAQNEIIALQAVNGQLFTATKHQQALSPGTPVIPTDPVRLWDDNFNIPAKAFKTNLKKIKSISASKDGKVLVIFNGLSAEIWDVQNSKILKEMILNDGYAIGGTISPDGKAIVAVDIDKHLIRLIRLK